MNFNRQYQIRIQVGTDLIVIKPPIKISFSGTRSSGNMANSFDCNIYNLSEAKRKLLIKDAEELVEQTPSVLLNFSFFVGYGDEIGLLFAGHIHTAGSRKTGSDFITSITCISSGLDMKNSFTNATLNNEDIVKKIVGDMPNTVIGKISPQLKPLLRPRVLHGNSYELLIRMFPNHNVFIDNGALYIVGDNEVIDLKSDVPVISPQNGLLNTPYRQFRKVTIVSLINSSIRLQGLVRLESQTQPHLNGDYRVESVTYKGDNWSNDWSQQIIGYTRPSKAVGI